MSLWTGTVCYRLTRRLAIMYSAAAAYANRTWEDTELVTDHTGIKVAERLGWRFRTYALALEGFCPAYAAHVFALGKLQAQCVQTNPYAHIDLDVLCYNLPPRRWREAPVAYQSLDEPDGYARPERRKLLQDFGLLEATPVNAGLIAWNDMGLQREYLAKATRIAYDAARTCGDGLAVSLVAEQAALGAVLRENGVRGEPLIPMASLAEPEDFVACHNCFTHLWDQSKNQTNWAARVEARFQKDFPAEYAAAVRGFQLLHARGLATC